MAPARHVVGHRKGREQARGIGAAGPGDVERGTMVGRGAHKWKTDGHVDAAREVDGLDRDQRLVVIHAERRVVGRARGGMEHRVGGGGTTHIDAQGFEAVDRRLDDAAFLVTLGALFARMWIGYEAAMKREEEAAPWKQAVEAHRSNMARLKGVTTKSADK